MNLSCYWSCLHHRLCNMHTICCLHYVVENLEGNIKMTKYVVEWYNSIGLFNKQAYIVPVNPIVIIFYHQQYRICPLKQSLFGWFTYRGFLTATCWNNRNVRVESTAGKTVHKLFVGGVYLTKKRAQISNQCVMGLLIRSQLLYWLILELIINFIPKFVIKCGDGWLVIHGGFNVNPY